MKIPLARPLFDQADEQAVVETLRSGWVGSGPRVAAFEQVFSNYVGAPCAAAVSSGTAALNIASSAAGFGPGDEVLVPAFTWISTPNAIEIAGARPVFCDIEPETFNIDVADAQRRITARTRGIVVVHMFGLAANIAAACELARKHGLFVIEDAACGLGARVNGQHVGTFGDVGCFSFHPRKSITTGEGGMLTTAQLMLDAKFRSLRDIGSDRLSLTAEEAAQQLMPDYPVLGNNYRMTDLQGALGVTQLAKFDFILQERLACAKRYNALIENSALNEWLQRPALITTGEHAYQAFVCTIKTSSADHESLEQHHRRRNRLMKHLFDQGIATRPGTHAPNMLGYYRRKYGAQVEDCPKAWRADRLTLALPLYAGLTHEDQQLICERLEQCWGFAAS